MGCVVYVAGLPLPSGSGLPVSSASVTRTVKLPVTEGLMSCTDETVIVRSVGSPSTGCMGVGERTWLVTGDG